MIWLKFCPLFYMCHFFICFCMYILHTSLLIFHRFLTQGREMPGNNQTIQSCKLLTQQLYNYVMYSHIVNEAVLWCTHNVCVYISWGAMLTFSVSRFFLLANPFDYGMAYPTAKLFEATASATAEEFQSAQQNNIFSWSLLTLALHSVESCLCYWFRRIWFMHLVVAVTINLMFFICHWIWFISFSLFIGQRSVQKWSSLVGESGGEGGRIPESHNRDKHVFSMEKTQNWNLGLRMQYWIKFTIRVNPYFLWPLHLHWSPNTSWVLFSSLSHFKQMICFTSFQSTDSNISNQLQ